MSDLGHDFWPIEGQDYDRCRNCRIVSGEATVTTPCPSRRTPIAPTMQVCGVDGCGIPLSPTYPCALHKTAFRFEVKEEP